MTPRSILFAPGDQPALAPKAAASAADAVCIDLEDAVAADAKPAARGNLPAMADRLRAGGKPIYVRVNPGLREAAADVAALPAGVAGLLLPKARDLTHAALIEEASPPDPDIRLIAMIEDIHAAAAFSAAAGPPPPRLAGLTIGAEDLAADLGCAADAPPIAQIFTQLALTAARLGVDLLGWPGSIGNFTDLDALRAAAQRGAAAGAIGGLCVHPKQASVLNAVFTPTPDQVDWARRVIAADNAAGGGATAVDGRMVDKPVANRAQTILARAQLQCE